MRITRFSTGCGMRTHFTLPECVMLTRVRDMHPFYFTRVRDMHPFYFTRVRDMHPFYFTRVRDMHPFYFTCVCNAHPEVYSFSKRLQTQIISEIHTMIRTMKRVISLFYAVTLPRVKIRGEEILNSFFYCLGLLAVLPLG